MKLTINKNKTMSKVWKKLLVLVTVAQLVLLSLPTALAQSESIKVMNTTAGQPALIMLSGEANAVVQLTITTPFKSVITQQYQLNEDGFLQYWYPQTAMAGEYIVEYQRQIDSFSVQAGLPDTKKSQLELSDYTAYVGSSLEGKVILKDHYGNLIGGRQLELTTRGSAHLTCSNACRTNQQGVMTFVVNSQQAGMKRLTVIDTLTGSTVFTEDLGFIPYVRAPIEQPSFTNFGADNQSNFPSYNPYTPYDPATALNYIPINDPTRANFGSQGGNGDLIASAPIPSHFYSFLGADLASDPSTGATISTTSDTSTTSDPFSTPEAAPLALAPANSGTPAGFQIIIGTDKTAKYEENKEVEANKALDYILRAVDGQGAVIKNFTGEVKFSLDPAGPLIPPDYQFKDIDQGEAVFELALVLPAGDYVFSAQDKIKTDLQGKVNLKAKLQNAPTLNNTNIILKIDSPVSNSTYSKTFSVQGSTNTDNTEIVVREGSSELKRGKVDDQKNYNFPLELEDGKHQLEITATYLVDGSETRTTVDLEVDKTAPVITSITVQADPVRAGELFTVTAEADENSIMKAFINNRSYDFTGVGKSYTLSANAPLDVGEFPVNIQIADKLGNTETSNSAGILKVIAALEELKNLFGIPGVGSIILSWDPVPGAVSYDVQYKSVLGVSPELLTTDKNKITVESLVPDVSYVFTVVAKDAAGKNLSVATDSKALKVLPPAVEGKAPAPVIEEPVHNAAEVQTLPIRQTKSGPEVYLLIFASIIVLNLYGRMRKALARAES